MATTHPEPKTELAGLSFEQAAAELEALVEEMENEVLPLEKMLASYERGVKLAQQCTRRLSDAEKRIELIKKLPDGGVETVPLDEAAAAASETEAPAQAVRRKADPAPRRKTEAAPAAPISDSNDDEDDDELALF